MSWKVLEWLVGESEPDCYMSVPYLRVCGAEEEIGRSLAEFAKTGYGVQALARYDAPIYARARWRYYRRNWPAMAARVSGVARAFGVDPKADDADPSALVYDISPSARGPIGLGSSCSAAFIPPPLSESKRNPIVARNFDAWRILPSQSGLFENAGANERCLYSRSFVVELCPTRGLAVMAIGGHDLLFPFQDAINEAGLFITSLADQVPPISKHMTMAGGENSGLSSRQLLLLLASRCRTVAKAKEEVLGHQVRQDFALHWLVADAKGEATVLELDEHGCFTFTDLPSPDEPLFVTNHQINPDGRALAWKEYQKLLHKRPDKKKKAYDSFVRLDTLMQRHDEHKRQGQKIAYSRSDVEQWLMDPVACTYDDYGEAGVPGHLRTRTAWSLTADLKKKDMEVRFYLRDCDDRPIIDNRKAVAWRRWRLAVGKAPHELCHEEIME